MNPSSATPFTRRVSLRALVLGTAAGLLLLSSFFALRAIAQEKGAAASLKQPAKLAHPAQSAPPEQESKNKLTTALPQHEDAEQLRKREEWFYKQRAFPLGHIPAGARLKAFQHMQRMMEAEGKLVRQPDGGFAAATLSGTITSTWIPIGPAFTNGGFFQPVTGRVTAIAVDPSDPSGDTVLIGGAQGGIWRSTTAGNSWTPVGDSNPSLAMGSIAFAGASSPGVVYAGTGEQASIGFDIYYGAGVLKSTDGGLHWAQTCTTATTTCPFIGPFSSGLPTGTFGFFTEGGARISYIAVNPQNPQLVLVGAQIPLFGGQSETAGGIFCSDNGGATWIALLSGQAGSFVGFASATTAYAALGRPGGTSPSGTNPNGIYKSTNANGSSCSAITFSPVTGTGLPAQSSMGRIDLGIAASDTTGNTLYASVANGGTDPTTGLPDGSRHNLGVFVTTNGGSTWTQTGAPDICQRQCWYDNVVKADPNNSHIVYLGGGAAIINNGTTAAWVERSTDGGTTFSPAIPSVQGSGLPHVDQHALAFVKLPTGKVRLYLGNDGGVWRTDDAETNTAVTWTNVNNAPLQLTQFYPSLSIHPSNANFAFGGTQDNGSQNRTENGLNTWTDNQACGDGGWTVVDPATPSTVYVMCQVFFINKSTTNGSPGSFNLAINGINFNDPVDFIAPIVIDPANPNRLYFGTSKVYQTVDGANTWQAISSDLSATTGAVIVSLAVGGGSNGNVVYTGTDDGKVFVSTNVAAGQPATFNSAATGLPGRTPTQIVVDPSDSTGNTAYATFSGFSGFADQLGHVFKTINAGALWTDISCHVATCGTPNPATDLPNIPVNDLVIDPDVPGTLYVATDLGVFATSDSSATWATLNNNSLPNVAVLSLKLHESSRTLRAATHGRGAWDLLLNNFTFTGPHITSLSPTFASAGDPQVSLAVNGSGFSQNSKIVFTLNGTSNTLTPTFSSAAQLVTGIPGSDIQAAGDAQVTVTDPGPPAATSNTMTFTVMGGAPTLSSINPISTPVQTPNPSTSVPITLTGTGFAANTQVAFNGSASGITVAAPTSSCPFPTCLQGTLPASLLGPFGSTDDITAVNPPPGGGASLPQTFKVVAPPPPNDNFANAMSIGGNSFTDTKDSSGATTENSDPLPACVSQFSAAQGNNGGHPNGLYNTIWYKFTAPAGGGSVAIDTNGSNYDTALSVWTGASQSALTAVVGGCNDDIQLAVILTSQVSFTATGGTTYFIMVSSFGPPDPNPLALGGKSVLNFTFTPPPFTLTPTPTSVTVTAGNPASYTVAVAPTGSFTGTVNLSCTSLPVTTTMTCAVTPNSVTLGASQNVTVNVTTTKRGVLPPTGFRTPRKPVFRTVPLVILAILVALLMALALRTGRRRLAFALPLAGLVLFFVFQAVGCGSGGGGGGGGGTAAGTYTITVTGNGGGSTSNAAVTLIVN